jgi:hypothetical protein
MLKIINFWRLKGQILCNKYKIDYVHKTENQYLISVCDLEDDKSFPNSKLAHAFILDRKKMDCGKYMLWHDSGSGKSIGIESLKSISELVISIETFIENET